ncbi:MAG: TolC family protein [Bacteroidota bacterium]
MKFKTYLCLFFIVGNLNIALAQTTVQSFDELINQVLTNTFRYQNNEVLLSQVKKERLAAVYGVLNPRGGLTGSFTNNTQLPVSLLPAEIVGGPAGTYEEVEFGLQYVSDVNLYAEVQLLNLAGWENLNLADLTIQLQESEMRLSLQALKENIAITYFNIVNLQKQLKAAKVNLGVADTLYQLTQAKYDNGLINQQNLNQSRVNQIEIAASIDRIGYLIEQQYVALKILCDLPETMNILIRQPLDSIREVSPISVKKNTLLVENALVNVDVQAANYQLAKRSFLPTISFFGNYSLQGNANRFNVFNDNATWINSNAIGLKLNVPIPSASQFRQRTQAEFQIELAKNQALQAKQQTDLTMVQLKNEYEKASVQALYDQEIYEIRKDSYTKNFINYQAGLLDLSETIDSYNAMLTSQYNYIAANVKIQLAKTKIKLNNQQ